MFLNQEQGRENEVKKFKSRKEYFRSYYLKNREKLLAYSKEAYQVKKSFSHTHALYTSNSIISCKDACFFEEVSTPLNQDEKRTLIHAQERQKRKDQSWRRLATRNKRPIKGCRGWNLPTWKELRSHQQLFKQYGEISTLTGKKLGNYYHSTLDFDLNKVDYPPKMVAKLFKEFASLLKYWKVSWDKGKRGGHIDLLTTELLPNEPIYYRGWGKIWEIGEVKSKGGYVVDVDKDKSFVRNGKWYRKFSQGSHAQLKKELGFFFFELGRSKKEENLSRIREESLASILLPIDNQKSYQTSYQLTVGEVLTIQSSIKQKIQLLINGQTYYRYNLDKSPHFFLFNTYNGSRDPPFRVGETYQIQVKSGRKWPFFARLF